MGAQKLWDNARDVYETATVQQWRQAVDNAYSATPPDAEGDEVEQPCQGCQSGQLGRTDDRPSTSRFYDVEGWARDKPGPRRRDAEILDDVTG